jgi:hypothetical protein
LVEEVARDLGPFLRETAAATVLCKDPQFSWTLPVWIAAGADIEHVVVSYRGASAMVGSRVAAGHLRFSSPNDARNAMIYAAGNVITALADSSVPHTILRFPQYLQDLDAVADSLPIPPGTNREAVRHALKELANDAATSK